LDLRYFRYFIAVAEELNFTRAAERLRTAQPSLSVRIKKLEEELGVSLFRREGRGIRLTEAGSIFLERARRLLADLDRAAMLAKMADKGEIGRLAIGYDAPAEFLIFPDVVPALRARWPGIQLSFHNMKNEDVLKGLRSETIDLGFVFLPISDDGFAVTSLTDVNLLVALPAGHRLAGKAEIEFGDLNHEPLILFPRALDPDFFREIEQRFARAGAAMTIGIEAASLLSGINFVAMGSGVSLMGEYAKRIAWDNVVYRPLAPPGLHRLLGLVGNRDAPQLVAQIHDFIVERVQALQADRARA